MLNKCEDEEASKEVSHRRRKIHLENRVTRRPINGISDPAIGQKILIHETTVK